jgi:hypothetical protein
MAQRSMGASMVVLIDEPVDERLEGLDGGGLVGLGTQPVLQGLPEPLDLAAGGRVVGAGVLLVDAEATQFVLQAVAARRAVAASSGEPGGEHHAVEFLSGVKGC